MKMIAMRPLAGTAVLAASLLLSACQTTDSGTPASAEVTKRSSQMLLVTSQTRDGVDLVYPDGKPQITSRISTFPPGSVTAVHRHDVPLYVFILEGELTLTTEGHPDQVFKAGEAFMEADAWHAGRNDGDVPLRLLAVYLGEEGTPLSVLKEAKDKK